MGLDLNDDLLTTGDPDSIDKALDEMELDDSLLFGEDGDEDDHGTHEPEEKAVDEDKPEDVEEQGTDDNQVEVIDTTGEQHHGDGDHEGEEEKPEESQLGVKEIDGKLYVAVDANNAEVMGKDGKHKIPYEVLDRARKSAGSANDLQKRVEELEGELQSTSKKQTMYEKQLTEAGINPDKLPDELLNDPEALARVQEEYPGEAGKVIAALVEKVKGQTGNETVQPVSSANPVEDALATDELKELNSWRDSDKDRWDMALIIDNKLSESPEFAHLPIAQRFVEVQRRVKASFDDPVQASIDKELADKGKQPEGKQPAQNQATPEPQKAAIPNSPSELGTSPQDTTQAGYEALAAQDPMALEHSMAGMTDEALESFLEQAGMAFD